MTESQNTDNMPDADQGLTQQPAADADTDQRGAPTADQQPTTPAPDQDTAAATTDRTQTTVEPADQQP